MNNIKDPLPFVACMPKYGHISVNNILAKTGELLRQAEYRSVVEGLRKANVYHLDSANYDRDIEKVTEDGLVFLPILRSKKYSGFSNKHLLTEQLGPNTMVFGVVARDLKIAREFKDAHKQNSTDHKKIGELLGYPKCCCDFFVKEWGNSYDPIYEAALNSKHVKNSDYSITLSEPNVTTYNHLRYFGLRVVPWLTCSNECKETIVLADQWLDLMRGIDKTSTNDMLSLMREQSKWNLSKSQVLVDHPKFVGYTSSYYAPGKREVVYPQREP